MKCLTTIIFSKPIKRTLLSETFDTTEDNAKEIAKRYYQDDHKIKVKIEVDDNVIFYGSYLDLIKNK